jgi:predicted alpha/beta superfamily hydrolase
MMTSRTYHSLHLDIATFDSSSIIYILLPHRLPEEERTALEGLSTRFETNIVTISEMDWNNDMTPWKAPAVKEGEFGGRASQFLDRLKGDIFFNLENSLQIRNPKRYLMGLSLSGLFTVWAAIRKPLFEGVASISGSFWYDGFAEWLMKQEELKCVRFYVSMGEKEKETKVKRFANIEEDTIKVVETLMLKGAEVAFEVTEGGHNSPVVPRIEKSVVSLLRNQ